jgi:glycosyltransferase involved in cell wall biosynthesis
MKFSVIIPLYNKAPYVRKALESVFAQTYTDYEVIVVDDGSTDDSACIVQQFIDERLKVKGEETSGAVTSTYNLSPITYKLSVRLITQSNAGVSAARNSGVATSSGDYIAFLDADDWWEPTYLEKMAKLIEDYPNAGLYASNYIYYKPGKTHVAVNNVETGYFNYPKAYYEGSAMPVWTGATMIPRRVLDEMRGFPLGIKLGEDFLLWARIAMQYKVAFLNEPLAWYNNDVPATLRATRNLHHPEHHMLFRMEVIGESLEVRGDESSRADTNTYSQLPIANRPTKADWKSLLDKLRVNGLLDYWLDKRYHDIAAQELAKVDWGQQPDSVKRIYKTPIWMLKAKRQVMKWGSAVKQALVKRIV